MHIVSTRVINSWNGVKIRPSIKMFRNPKSKWNAQTAHDYARLSPQAQLLKNQNKYLRPPTIWAITRNSMMGEVNLHLYPPSSLATLTRNSSKTIDGNAYLSRVKIQPISISNARIGAARRKLILLNIFGIQSKWSAPDDSRGDVAWN